MDEVEDGVGGTVYGAWGTKAATDFGEVHAHGGAERRRAEESDDFVGDAVGGEVGLDEFWDGALFGDEIDHAEKFCADERLGEESGERRDAIDDNHGDVKESGFDSGGSAGDDSGVGGGEGVVGLVGDVAQGDIAGQALEGR